MQLKYQPIDEQAFQEIIQWIYEGPYDIYSLGKENAAILKPFFLNPGNGYFRIDDKEGILVGYCCFGQDGQVPGGDYSLDALDIGLGIRPDLTGNGWGRVFVQSVIDYAWDCFEINWLRVTIAGFNQRAQKVWRQNGFQFSSNFNRKLDGKPFIILTKKR